MISPIAAPNPVFRIELVRQLWRFAAGMALTALAAVLIVCLILTGLAILVPLRLALKWHAARDGVETPPLLRK